MPLPIKLDHCVVHVSDWERSNAFYRDVLGAELVPRPVGFAYRFGDTQLNLHGPGFKPAEVARLPVQPGNSDLCFEWKGPIADAIAHLAALRRCGRARADGTVRRQGQRDQRLLPRSRRLAHGIHFVRVRRLIFSAHRDRLRAEDALAEDDMTIRNLMELPPDLPVPVDDGARAPPRLGSRLPDVALGATDGTQVNLSKLAGRTVVYVYPRTGEPGKPSPDGWDAIPGARGCTPQSCGFRDHFAELTATRACGSCYGLSTQDTGYQREAAERLHLPFAILSDADSKLTRGDAPADLHGRRHDVAQAHGLGDRRRRHHQGVLSGVPARPECRGGDRLAADVGVDGMGRSPFRANRLDPFPYASR